VQIIVGSYRMAGLRHGFVLDNGTYSTVDFPGGNSAIAFGINAGGVIVGMYLDSAGAQHGFVMHP